MLRNLTDEQLLETLKFRRETAERRNALWGASTLRSDQSLISEAYDKLYEAQWEAKRRGMEVAQ